ncbi:MAG: BBP7 family outer membrane beta-barrel protein, partial [Planctomycetia bacterium]
CDSSCELETLSVCEINNKSRFYVRPELLLWWTKNADLPPLVTASPNGTTRDQAGVLDAPGTTVLYGDGDQDGKLRPGFRLWAGVRLDDCGNCWLDLNAFGLADQDDGDVFASPNGTPIISRPFFNVNTGRPDAELVGLPGVVDGTVTAAHSSEFGGAGAAFRSKLCGCCEPMSACGGADQWGYRVEGIAGYRYLKMRDGLSVTENLTARDPGGLTPIGTKIDVFDSFQADNQFHGGQLGLATQFTRGRLFVDLFGSVALGVVNQTLDVGGRTTVTQPGANPVSQAGGLLALPSNIGSYSNDEFAVAPEIGFNVGYQMTKNVRASVGYTFLYLSDVLRSGDQIDLGLNPNLIPSGPGGGGGAARPGVTLDETDVWAQGLQASLEWRF